MTTAIMPARRWAGDEVEPPPVPRVLVSSRDGAPVPVVRNAVKLAEVATSHGWTARQTYALAEVPERRYQNGNLAKGAHMLASVAVRLRRHDVGGWAAWHREDERAWRFDAACIALYSCGFEEILAAVAA